MLHASCESDFSKVVKFVIVALPDIFPSDSVTLGGYIILQRNREFSTNELQKMPRHRLLVVRSHAFGGLGTCSVALKTSPSITELVHS